MFARVSTYQPGPDSTGAPTEDTVNRVLELPGCQGIYYLKGTGTTSLSITLWDSEESLTGSQQAANAIRTESSEAQHMQILGVEEYEVLTQHLKN